jgi:hypothetical protein
MVLSREGALPELALGNDSAVLAEPESPEAFAAGIRHLVSRGAPGPRSGNAGALRFSADHIADRVKSAYDAALA